MIRQSYVQHLLGLLVAMIALVSCENPLIVDQTYSVLYDGNGHTSGTVPQDDGAYDEEDRVSVRDIGDMRKTGYLFTGWNSLADGTGTHHHSGEVILIGNENIVLYAQWEEEIAHAPSRYGVVYRGNGSTSGTSPVDPTDYASGESAVVLDPQDLSRDGYSFSGWNTDPFGTGEAYAPGDSVVIENDDLFLYAMWSVIPLYRVVYHGNGHTSGSPPVDGSRYEFGQPVVVEDVGRLRRSGHDFTGWNTREDGLGTPHAPGERLTMGETDIALYAQWTVDLGSRITYHANGDAVGTVPVDLHYYAAGDLATAQVPNDLSWYGYSFGYWNTMPDGNGTNYLAGLSIVMTESDLDLFAIWIEQPTYEISYLPNGATTGSAPLDPQSYLEGETAIVRDNENALERDRYEFKGWNRRQDGRGASYAAGDQIVMGTRDIVLYAEWVALPTFSVVYDPNGATGGSVPEDPTEYLSGETAYVPSGSDAPERSGFTFAGWNTDPLRNGESYAAGEPLLMSDSDVTLYAQWDPNVRTVVDSSSESTFIILDDARAWVTGANYFGQLGTGNSNQTRHFTGSVGELSDLSSSSSHTLFVTPDGTAWGVGSDEYGQLGDESPTTITVTPVALMADVARVFAGPRTSFLVKSDGTVWASGLNDYGQLGDGSATDRFGFVEVLSDVKSVAPANGFTMFLDTGGTLWATGRNSMGQFGNGTTTDSLVPVPIMTEVADVVTESWFTIVLKQDGSLWGSGWNNFGSLGDGTSTNRSSPVRILDRVTAITSGDRFTMVLRDDDSLWGFGYNVYGQVGTGTTENQMVPVQVMSDVATVSAGTTFTLVVKTDGTVWGFGSNGYGQLTGYSFDPVLEPRRLLW